MSRRNKDEDRIAKLLEDTSTPEVSEKDPYSDDGEYASDKDFEPDYNELSSDSDCPRNRQRLVSVQHSTRYDEKQQSDTESDDEVADIQTVEHPRISLDHLEEEVATSLQLSTAENPRISLDHDDDIIVAEMIDDP